LANGSIPSIKGWGLVKKRIGHDRLFKELLETFFGEFVELFFPQVYEAIDLEHIKFLQQEVFTDVTRGDKHRIDILVETSLKGESGIVLVHVENQASAQKDFAERMFIYFSRLYQKHRCRVVPIAVFTYPEKRNEPDRFKLAFPFMSVLDFHFLTLELNKHKWQDYIQSKNPVAAALLSKMGYQKKERVQVKLEFLRMLVRMELDPARMTLLTGFFETYLILNEEEERKLEEEMGKVDEKEAKRMIEITTSWEEKGRVKGQASILLRLLKKKFGNVPVEMENRVMTMPTEKLQNLAEAIFDLGTLDEVDNFINR
jgi:predicted transposase/invertase (TIGR01784 family)